MMGTAGCPLIPDVIEDAREYLDDVESLAGG